MSATIRACVRWMLVDEEWACGVVRSGVEGCGGVEVGLWWVEMADEGRRGLADVGRKKEREGEMAGY